jgi:hypothetical protein
MNPLPAAKGAYPAPCPDTQPVRGPTAYEKYGDNPNECSGNWPTTVYIEDSIMIPQHIAPGRYVLGAHERPSHSVRNLLLTYSFCMHIILIRLALGLRRNDTGEYPPPPARAPPTPVSLAGPRAGTVFLAMLNNLPNPRQIWQSCSDITIA